MVFESLSRQLGAEAHIASLLPDVRKSKCCGTGLGSELSLMIVYGVFEYNTLSVDGTSHSQ